MINSSSDTIYLNNFNHFNKLLVWADLVKYKLSLAVAFSSATGYFLYRNNPDQDFFLLVTGVFLLASGSVALNQFIEREQDSIMERTRDRPIPAGKISPGLTIFISSSLLFSGSGLLLAIGAMPFALGIICVVIYNFVYTPLKKITALAILPGAVVGGIPPLIGFVSAGGTILSNEILLFSTIIFLWQLPHFWLLLLRYGEEYQAAGFKTISTILNEKQIRYLIFFWVLISSGFLLLFVLNVNKISSTLAYILIIMNSVFILIFFRSLLLKGSSRDIRNAFIMLNFFGLVIMLILIVNSLLNGP